MKEDNSTKCWNRASKEWCEQVAGDEHRTHFIMPYTLKWLGDVTGKKILDLGCGEGGYSRELAKRNAEVVAVDCAEYSIEYAKRKASENELNIAHYIRNSNDLYGIKDNYFDIVLCSMLLMDCEDFCGTIKEIARVLKPSGKLFASVLHPCFNGNHDKGIGRQDIGIDRKVVVKNYFYPTEWEELTHNGTAIIWRHRTLQDYVKTFLKCGLTIVDINEPAPTEDQANISIGVSWLNKIPIFLFWELQK
jgi:Methylase involved in ubiquinone/menaquinone biosynthesis